MKLFFKKAANILYNKHGDGYVDTAVKMIIAVVVGALLLGGLYYLFNSIVLPGLADRIQDMFGSPGGSGNDGGGGGIIFIKQTAEFIQRKI